MVAFGVGDLIASDAVPAVQAVQEAKLEELIEYAIDRRCRSGPLSTQPIGDLLSAHQALPLARKQLHDRGAHGARAQTSSVDTTLGPRQPSIAKLRIHGPDYSR